MHHLDLDVLLENYIQHDNKKKGRILEESIFLRFEQLRIILRITRPIHGMRHRTSLELRGKTCIMRDGRNNLTRVSKKRGKIVMIP